MALHTCIMTAENVNQTACLQAEEFWVEVEEDKLAEASTGWRQCRLHTDITALVPSISSGKELFWSQVLVRMEQLAPRPRLWFPTLQHEPVYFANLFEVCQSIIP